ncbi:unnamed protein product [Arctia plantaginis]|uniref:Peptidase S1 domain-containing protein n=1 Tax=Arctia plantaginis TaxID=874455 RepID=A0A8S0YSF1_ARCPL|nr:unnamed protein product [Arctia plantaginis]
MLTKAVFLLLAVAVIQIQSEYIEPKFFEDMVPVAGRIVSGWDAVLGQHPHQAHLRLERAGFAVGCGGSFVHPEWLISAAHCTALSVNIFVRGGAVSLDETPEYLEETNQYWNHPTYDSSAAGRVQPNDICLIKLQVPATFTNNLAPIRVQSAADASQDFSQVKLVASGFGHTWTGGPGARILQWVFLRGVSNAHCRLTYGSIVTDATVCAHYFNVTSQSTCQGDSGGPLVHTNPKGHRILIGAASFVASPSFGGCHSGMPAAFIRPGYFHDWFTEISGIDFENQDEQFIERESLSLN